MRETNNRYKLPVHIFKIKLACYPLYVFITCTFHHGLCLWVGALISNLSRSHFRGLSESVEIFGFQGVLCAWQLVFASFHRLIPKKKKNMPKRCMMVMANLSDLGHGKNWPCYMSACDHPMLLFIYFLFHSLNLPYSFGIGEVW